MTSEEGVKTEKNCNVFLKKIKILLNFSKSVIETKKCESPKSGKTFMMLNKIENQSRPRAIYFQVNFFGFF